MTLRTFHAFAATIIVTTGTLAIVLASVRSSAQPVPGGAPVLDVSGVVTAANPAAVTALSGCDGGLKFPQQGAKSELLPIEFCKELVIVDPDVIAGLGELSFPNIMSRFFGNAADAVVESFARSWVDEASNHGEASRTEVYKALYPDWQKRIKLIAVVNRLDLSANPDIPMGEGRLIYQLFEGASPLEMTFILEFDYPRLTGSLGHHGEWAKKWHELSAANDVGAYTKQLLGVVNGFAQAASFRRIRTNEKLSFRPWAFREYAYIPCAHRAPATTCSASLKWKQLDHTPLDKFHDDASAAITLENYLVTVLEVLQNGTHKFDTSRIDLDWNAEVGSWFDSLHGATKGMLLMAFATCNGCHADFKKHDARPHISVRGTTGRPVLSSFLTEETEVNVQLPGCDKESPLSGCRSVGDRHYWNEQWYRVTYLESLLVRPRRGPGDATAMSVESASEMSPAITGHHRYH